VPGQNSVDSAEDDVKNYGTILWSQNNKTHLSGFFFSMFLTFSYNIMFYCLGFALGFCLGFVTMSFDSLIIQYKCLSFCISFYF
jgi:hypothetical protein